MQNKLVNYKDVASVTGYSLDHSRKMLTEVRNAKKRKRISLEEFLDYHQIKIETRNIKDELKQLNNELNCA